MKRLFTLAIGVALGASVAVRALRRFDQARDAIAPSVLTDRLASSASELRRRFDDARSRIRHDAALHEAALREQFDVPPLPSEHDEDSTWIH